MPTVYILYSTKLDRYYVGSTINFERRFNEHESGINPSTKSGRPWSIMFTHETPTYANARNIENRIKSWKNRRIIEKIICDQKIRIDQSAPT